MKTTTRLLIPAMALAASTLLMAQETPGQPPKRKPTPTPPSLEPEAFPAPGDSVPAPTPVTPAPIPVAPPIPALTPSIPTTPAPAPIVPAIGQNPPNETEGEPFIGFGTINGARVSARGKPTIFSALVFRFNKNEPVNIVKEINIANPKAGEPRKWLQVQVPADAGVWVHVDFLSAPFKKPMRDANGQPVEFTFAKVKANLLNVRGGAGEHFPILGKLSAGATVHLSGQRKEKWVELFAPANTTVYVAAQFVLRKEVNEGVIEIPFDGVVEVPSTPLPVNPPSKPIGPATSVSPPTVGRTTPTAPTTPPETIVTIPAEAFGQPNGLSIGGVPIKRATTPKLTAKVQPSPAIPPTPTPQPAETVKPSKPVPTLKPVEPTKVAEANSNLPPASTEKPGTNEPPIRIVTREGYVRRTLEIQAPSGYVLEHIESGKKINYLLLNHPTLKLNWFIGKRVLVSGQEAIDARHANTPVLKVKTLKGEVSKEALTRIATTQAKSNEPEKSHDK
jgi:SH3-like domain-containing protein|tara:strand:+ start:746 stop:2260 length:1515 start_codon:yes stop_codon:yes gene_type:complete